MTKERDPLLKDLGFEGEAFIILGFLLEDLNQKMSPSVETRALVPDLKAEKTISGILVSAKSSSWL